MSEVNGKISGMNSISMYQERWDKEPVTSFIPCNPLPRVVSMINYRINICQPDIVMRLGFAAGIVNHACIVKEEQLSK